MKTQLTKNPFINRSFTNQPMNNITKICASALLGVLLVAGCGGNNAEAPTEATTSVSENPSAPATGAAATKVATGKPKGSVKVGDKIICAVCAVKDGTREAEAVQATLDYKGKTYGFCSKAEEAEFISTPAKYADAS